MMPFAQGHLYQLPYFHSSVLSLYSNCHMRSIYDPFAPRLLSLYTCWSRLSWTYHRREHLFLQHDGLSIPVLFTLSIGVRLFLLLVQSRNKIKYLKQPYDEYPPEATSGILNRSFLWWLIPLFFNGFKKLLLLDDLFSVDPSMSSEMLRDQMQLAWDRRCKLAVNLNMSKHSERPSSQTRNKILSATGICQMPTTAHSLPCPSSFMLNWFHLCSAVSHKYDYCIRQRAHFVPGYKLRPWTDCCCCLGLWRHRRENCEPFFLFKTHETQVSTVCYKHQLYRSITMLRGALVGIIYNRTLISPDGMFDEVAAVTLMSTDVDRIALSQQVIHEVWARIIEVAIGVWLLERQLGAACIVPILIVAGMLIGLVDKMGTVQHMLMDPQSADLVISE
jgi:ATP-binding cassette subfamily C (CFTR/MRP) protein 1